MIRAFTPFLVALLVCSVFSSVHAQKIAREIIASNGGYHEGELLVSWTIGEPLSEVYIKDDVHQTQGFQQGAYLEEVEFLQTLELEGNRMSDQLVNLDWSLVNERAASGYFIERRLEHKDQWEEVAFVGLSKDLNVQKQYDFVDLNGFFGITYYRIQQVDEDGNPLYSNEIAVKGNPLKGSFTVFPSPTTGPLNLGANKTALSTEQELEVRISDINGQQLFLTKVNREGAVTVLPNISHLSAGTYTVSVLSDKKVQQSFRITKIAD
ncbi:MAG: T9SS type A sorting domain-containing protein [Bacteroidota bacterium]